MPFITPPSEPLAPDSWRWVQWFSGLATAGSWTPTFTGLTVVLGGGSVAYAGRWQKVQRVVFFTVTITPSGGATVASVAGTTYHDLPFTPVTPGTSTMSDVTSLAGIGAGVILTSGRNYVPAKAATSDQLIISGSYEY